MSTLADIAILVKFAVWACPRLKSKFRKRKPVRVLLPSWMDEEPQSHWVRINSWDDIRRMAR